MIGKLVAGGIVLSGLIAGAVMYYLQVYHFYDEIPALGHGDVVLTNMVTDEPEPIIVDGFEAIDATSSPIRYRACFETIMSIPMLSETYVPYETATPRTAPGWFDCFDAEALGEQIDAGTAFVFLGQANIEYGIDRVVAITDDGRGFVWHEINACGRKAFDGKPVGPDCPPPPQ